MRLLVVWLVNALVLLVLPWLIPSIRISSFGAALLAALLLGLVNAVLRPLLILLTLPVTILTLGLFIFVINGLLFMLVAAFVPGFSVGGLLPAMLGALLYSVFSWLLSSARL